MRFTTKIVCAIFTIPVCAKCPTVTRAHDYRLQYQGLIIGKSKVFFSAPLPTTTLVSTHQICTTDAVLEACKSSLTPIYFQGLECVGLEFHFFRANISVFNP